MGGSVAFRFCFDLRGFQRKAVTYVYCISQFGRDGYPDTRAKASKESEEYQRYWCKYYQRLSDSGRNTTPCISGYAYASDRAEDTVVTEVDDRMYVMKQRRYKSWS